MDRSVSLARLVSDLRASTAVTDKVNIETAYAPAQTLAGSVRVGDDCAVIPEGDGYLLFAAEGILHSFVADDPWFAGYSAVMVNLSDVAAMGGQGIAVVDVLWTPDLEQSSMIWEGLGAASRAYGVPIVGGHTTITRSGPAFIAAAVLGKAKSLLTSFDAQPGDDLLMAIDLRGSWRGDKPFWNASVGAPSLRLRSDLALLPALAASGYCCAAKDISNGGIIGTLAMFLQCSKVGAELYLDQIPKPHDCSLSRWLTTFPSFGYLLSVPPKKSDQVIHHFGSSDIACRPIGRITSTCELWLSLGADRQEFMVRGS